MKEVTMKWAADNVEKINLIDVRSPGEHKAHSVKGSKNIPMVGLIMNSEEFLNKEDTYYIHCQGGVRSVSVIDNLEGKGYKLINCKGGIGAL